MRTEGSKKIYEGITNIREDIIEEALDEKVKKRVHPWRYWGAVAACLCLIIGGAVWFRAFQEKPGGGGHSAGDSENRLAVQDAKATPKVALETSAPDLASSTPKQDDNQMKNSGSGVEIPAIELPEVSDDASISMDMIGCLVYKGKIYTQAEIYQEETEQVSSLIGEKLGRAKGNLDEWSSQKDYSKEFASTYSGDVYTVKGYSTDFRLCCVEKWEEDGKEHKMVAFVEHLNGIVLKRGEELFGDWLHLRGNIRSVRYQKYDDWFNGREKYVDLTAVSSGQMDSFLEALYEGTFEEISETAPEFYQKLAEDIDGDYKKEIVLPVFMSMKDGTEVALRLYKNGYVEYEYMHGWYFVKVPKEIIAPFFSASE